MSNIIYIYSKYSHYCNDIKHIIDKIEGINTLCIDNPVSRKRVLLNHNLNINQVPTIIVNSETIKIYEGEIAKQFLLDVYNNMFPEKQNEEVSSIQDNIEELSSIQDNKEEVISIQDVVSKEVSSIQDVVTKEEVSSIQDVVSNEEDNENKEIDLMSKVEELQKMRESMIASEKIEPEES